MLDSTDPAQVKDVDAAVRMDKALFIVSSKSGGTLEPNIFADYFLARATEACGAETAAKHFIAVTDPGSSLEKRAKDSGWAGIFYGVPSIGGRYSVLSKFGLVPGAAIGLDIEGLLRSTRIMARACAADVPPEENPGVQLGVALGVAARRLGRDKVTIVASPAIAPIGAWLEQLLAESTGKHGLGLIPVADEPLGPPEVYGSDRFFAYVELEGGVDPAQRAAMQELAKAGHPVATLSIKDVAAIVSEIASACSEQSSSISQINKALTQMDEVTQQNSALVEENAASAKTLEHQSETMNDKVAFFKLDEGAESHAVKPPAVRPPAPAPAARAAAKMLAKPPAKREAAPARKPASAAIAAAALNGRRGGPVGRMQAAVATAMAEDADWKEF